MADYFTSTGDAELWLIRDFDGQLPVFVVPGRTSDGLEAWRVDSCVAMDGQQSDWLHKHLDEIKFARRAGSWMCRPATAKLKLTKAAGITPSFYIHWRNLTAKQESAVIKNGMPPDDLIESDMSSASDAFVRYTANFIGTDDLAGARRLWMQFCRCAVNWMTVEQKPLDMFFCRLRAMPYRKNWEQIMAAKFPGFLEYAELTREERMKRLELTNLKWHLALPEMAAVHTSATFDWTVSVELRDYFFDHTRKNEQKEFNRIGPIRYFERWRRIASSAYSGAVDTLAAFFVQASWPLGDVDRGLPKNSQFLRRLLHKGKVRPSAPDVPETDFVVGGGPPDSSIKRKGRPLNAEAPGVSTVPDEDINLDVRPGGGAGYEE